MYNFQSDTMGRPIILDEGLLHEAFLPQNTLCRDSHKNEILNCLSPIKTGNLARNLYVYGSPGAGKSTVVRSVLRDHFKDMHVYVNCWSNRTSHKVMEAILSQMGFMVHGKESTSELIRKFERLKRKVIICLDEADHLKDNDLLYTFTRNSCPLILISNYSYSPINMDNRIRSSLHLHEVEFGGYDSHEITQILQDRIDSGLHPQSISDELISEIARSSGGDARASIQILKNAAIDAESRGAKTIALDHVKIATKCARKYRLSYLLRKLNEHQQTLYELLKQNKVMDSGRLFNQYRKSMNETVTDRSYRNYMTKMVELGLVRQIGSGRWKKYEVTL